MNIREIANMFRATLNTERIIHTVTISNNETTLDVRLFGSDIVTTAGTSDVRGILELTLLSHDISYTFVSQRPGFLSFTIKG